MRIEERNCTRPEKNCSSFNSVRSENTTGVFLQLVNLVLRLSIQSTLKIQKNIVCDFQSRLVNTMFVIPPIKMPLRCSLLQSLVLLHVFIHDSSKHFNDALLLLILSWEGLLAKYCNSIPCLLLSAKRILSAQLSVFGPTMLRACQTVREFWDRTLLAPHLYSLVTHKI